MGYRKTDSEDWSPPRRDAADPVLLEPREALPRGRVTLTVIPGPYDAIGPSEDRPFVASPDGLRPSLEEALRAAAIACGGDAERRPRETRDMRRRAAPESYDITGAAKQNLKPDQDCVILPPDTDARARPIARTATKLPAVIAQNVFEAFVPSREREANHDIALQRLWRRGLVLIAVFGGAMGVWSLATTMSSAVIAPGQFVVDGSVKKVQHPTGGVVGELLVREGDQVAQGDLLIQLDETVTRANLQVIVRQLDELVGRKARLEAERDGMDVVDIPAELTSRSSDPEVDQLIAAEQKLFQVRRAAREGHRAQLAKRIAQLQDEIHGLGSQLEANAREAQILVEELKGARDLFAKGLTSIMQLNGLERQAVNLTGQKGQLTASIAQIKGKIAEVELQIMQIDDDLRAETQKDLREVQGKIAELSERRVAADDQLKRVDLRAPSAGTVHQLTVHTVGGVIVAAEPAMLIVPNKDELILEARVHPQDRDQLQVGQKAVVRIQSSNHRTTPELNGTLSRIAPDVSKDSTTSGPFYTVWIAIPRTELARVRGLSITAGMQAEVFIEAGSRSPLSYLLRPLTDQVARAFKER